MRSTSLKKGLLLTPVLLAWVGLPSCQDSSSKILVRVGSRIISERQVQLRNQVAKLEYPNSAEPLGLNQLTRAFTSAEIMARHGQPVTTEILEKEAERIDRQTLMPAKLEEYKSIFGKDRKAYLEVYVLPIYVGRALYFDLFLHDAGIQAHSLEKAKKFLDVASRQPGSLEALARKEGYPVSSLWASEKSGLRFGEAPQGELPARSESGLTIVGSSPDQKETQKRLAQQNDLQAAMESERWIQDIFTKVPKGKFFGKVVDWNDKWLVVQNLGPRPGGKVYLGRAVLLPKDDFSTWLEAESARLKE